VKVGPVGVVSSEGARGVVGGEGDVGVGLLNGGGGGGIRRESSAWGLRSCLFSIWTSVVVTTGVFASSTRTADPSWPSTRVGASFSSVGSFFAISLTTGRVSHCRKDHEDGGCL
jgi:hypothetical protein